MENIIIILVIVVIIALAIINIINKKKNKASCCGSGTYVAKSRKIGKAVYKQEFVVEDMHCQNCVNRVMEAVQDLDGTSAHVVLNKGLLTVTSENELNDDVILDVVSKKGYPIKVKTK